MTRSGGTKSIKVPSARAVADNAPIGIFRADSAGRITYINPALERISGVSAQRALGSSWLRSVPVEARSDAEREWQQAIAVGENWETEFRFKHPGGSTRYASILMAAELDAAREVRGFTGYVTDITEERASQAQLRKSERLFRLLAENATDIIVRLDLDDHVTYASPAMAEITGFTAEETKGINPISFMHPDDSGAAKESSRQLKAGEIEHGMIEYRTPHKDGHLLWLEARSRLVRNSRGEPTEVITVVRDISDHKRLEAELIAAREAERQASAAQSRFLAAMSHEIRTPISGVIGMIDLLINASDDDQVPRYRAALASSARTLLRVVDDVLDYSRLSNVGITLETTPFDVFAMVHNVIDLYRPAASEKGLLLGLQFQAPVRHAAGDATRLSQILGNLVANAIKFTDQGRIDIDVRQQGVCWTFAVTDTGIGISVDQQQRLFEAFAQADDQIAAKSGGTGLGLVITRLIVEAMGGSITVDSAPGQGARFAFDIPLQACSAVKVTDLISKKIGYKTNPLRLLVADDNEVNLLYLTRLLERMGHHVEAVADGLAAVDAASAGRFDAILLDRHMPRMNGEEAARIIRQSGHNRNCLLVMVSAAPPGTASDPGGLSGYFDANVPKPVRAERLEAILATCGQSQEESAVDSEGSLWSGLEESLGTAAAAELEGLFRQDLVGRVARLNAAIDANDLPTLQHEAHAIAGAAYLIGETAVGDAAQSAETAPEDAMIESAIVLRNACVDYLSINSDI